MKKNVVSGDLIDIYQNNQVHIWNPSNIDESIWFFCKIKMIDQRDHSSSLIQ